MIVGVINKHTRLERFHRTANYTGCCPFHHEQTPSFVVNEKTQIFQCFGCGVSGNVDEFKKLIKEKEKQNEKVS